MGKLHRVKSVAIVSAGGFGGEVLEIFRDQNRIEKQWNIAGFIDDDKRLHRDRNLSYSGTDKCRAQHTAGYTSYSRSGRRNCSKNDLMYVSATISAMIRQ